MHHTRFGAQMQAAMPPTEGLGGRRVFIPQLAVPSATTAVAADKDVVVSITLAIIPRHFEHAIGFKTRVAVVPHQSADPFFRPHTGVYADGGSAERGDRPVPPDHRLSVGCVPPLLPSYLSKWCC